MDPSLYPEGDSFDERPIAFDINDAESINEDDFARLTSASEYLYAVLQSTQFNGISALEAMGERAFADTDDDGFPEVVDAWGNPMAFQIEMYFNNGELFPEGWPNPTNLSIPENFTAGLMSGVAGVFIPEEIFDVENIRIRIVSTGGTKTAGESRRELITN